ncbi:MAG: hypothetical protein HWN66_00060 [Candidatus Helarchaeota archaeon]|nr:hypothetical protein [Candidatus Helarchaeota archaeon]
MINELPWIIKAKDSKFPIDLPINTQGMMNFLKSGENTEGFYNSLEETFWAVIYLKKLGAFPETNRKKLITYILKHQLQTGGYSNRIDGDTADLWSTFYAIALLHMMGVFKERPFDEQVFCSNCGKKQLFKTESCFNCKSPLAAKKKPCIICNRVVQKSSSSDTKWENLCSLCHENFLENIEFILKLQKSKGFKHCELEKCIICKGRPSYKSTFFAINALLILDSVDRLDIKEILGFLKKDQYTQEIDRIFQILSYYLLDTEDIDYVALLESIIPFQHQNSGFGIEKKMPVVLDTFWSVVPFYLLKQINLIQLGAIYNFLLGLKRGDGGYSEQIMDTMSNILSSILSYLIILMVFDPLIEQIEDAILRQCSSKDKIYLAPIAKKTSVSEDMVESVAYYLLSKEWFAGKILDQLDYFNDYLETSNVVTQKIGRSLIKTIQNQKPIEINLSEFSKNFEFPNAEERVKTVSFDLIVKNFIEGEIKEIKKTFKKFYLLSNINLPRNFITLEQKIPVDTIFDEKAQISPTRQTIEVTFQQFLAIPHTITEEISKLLEQKEIEQARKKLELGVTSFNKEIDEFEGNLTEILSKFRYIDFKETMKDFFEQWPINKKTLILYMDKFKDKMTGLIDEKEKSKEHEELLSKEQRIIKNFEEYLQLFIDKVDLLTQNFKKFFQQNYKNHQLANIKVLELNENIDAFFKDLTEKNSQFNESIEITQITETVKASKNLLDSKIKLLKEIFEEATKILTVRENLPNKIDEDIQTFKAKLAESQTLIKEKIEKKEFELVSKELETQDNNIIAFNTTISQNLEKDIGNKLASFTNFNISFNEFRVLLKNKLKQLEIEWTSQKEELLTTFHEKTELTKKNELNNKVKKFLETETERFDSLKHDIENLIKHENIQEAKSKLETAISEFNQTCNEFELEINTSIKEISRQYKTFKKLVNTIVLELENDKVFLLQSMRTLLDQINNLSAEKDLLTQQKKLEHIIKNQKLVISKQFSNFLKHYNNSLENNKVLDEESSLQSNIQDTHMLLRKGSSQIDVFLKENLKRFADFSTITEEQMKAWQKTTNIIENALQKLGDNLAENKMIERIYFVIKAFEGYRAELKYLAKAIHTKSSQLKDKLVSLLSNSRLEGTLDPINDILTLTTLKPITNATHAFLKELEEEIGGVLQIDFLQKEEIPKEIEDKKQYLLQLRYLLIIHRSVGSALYHRKFGTWEIDPDLISGFLTAIQSFGSEIKAKSVPIRKMAYKEFEILLNQGELVVTALIVDGKTSEWHEMKLATFMKEFEDKFRENLAVWSGELTQFKTAGLMIDQIFELYRAYI